MVRHHLHGDFDHFVGVRIAPLRTEISVARRAKLPAQVAAGEPSGSTSQPGAATAKIVVVAGWQQQPKSGERLAANGYCPTIELCFTKSFPLVRYSATARSSEMNRRAKGW